MPYTESASGQQLNPYPLPPPPRRRKYRWVLIVLLILFVLFIGMCVAAYYAYPYLK